MSHTPRSLDPSSELVDPDLAATLRAMASGAASDVIAAATDGDSSNRRRAARAGAGAGARTDTAGTTGTTGTTGTLGAGASTGAPAEAIPPRPSGIEELRNPGMRAGIAVLPGTVRSCFVVTVLTVLLALFADHPWIDPVLRTLYFGVLFGFFLLVGRRHREVAGEPYRLVVLGFLVLTLGFTGGAAIRLARLDEDADWALLLANMERGAPFLLGLVLISFGTILWIPQVLEMHRALQQSYRRTKGQLYYSEAVRQRMEQRFVEADRLHALGELAAGIAHDLRNPLAIVKAAAESLAARARTPEDLAEHSRVISRNIDKAERTIAGLLELGKPRTRRVEQVALEGVVAEVLALLSVEAKRRRVEVHRSCEPALSVATDQKLLSQVVLNMVLNAMQASPDGGRVQVTTRSHRIAAQHFAVIAVEDRGSGIAEDDRGRLFTPFFTTKREGTGLGLLASRRILHELGGRIDLFPRTRGGARAVVLLPLAAQEALVS